MEILRSPRFTPVINQFLRDTRFTTGLFGPLGCGKTLAGCHKGYLYATEFPGSKGLIVRDTIPSLRDTTMAEWFKWYPDGSAGKYHKTERIFTLNTPSGVPSTIYFRAFDDEGDIKNALGLEVDWIFLDEPQGGPNPKGGSDPGIAKMLFDSLLGRIGRRAGYPLKMLWMTGNPPSTQHWIARWFEYSGTGPPVNAHNRKRLYLTTQADRPPNQNPGYYEDLAEVYGLDTPMGRRFLLGEWVDFASMQPFKREWVVRYGGEGEVPTPRIADSAIYTVTVGVDPAISKRDTAARTAIVAAAQCRHGPHRGLRYILDARAGHWSVAEQVQNIVQLAQEWRARRIRVESVAYQKALIQILEADKRIQALKGTGGMAVTEEARPDGDKLRRANSWSGFVQNGRIVFNRRVGVEDLIDSMLSIPGDKSKWDMVDAAGIALGGFDLILEDKRLSNPPAGVPTWDFRAAEDMNPYARAAAMHRARAAGYVSAGMMRMR